MLRLLLFPIWLPFAILFAVLLVPFLLLRFLFKLALGLLILPFVLVFGVLALVLGLAAGAFALSFAILIPLLPIALVGVVIWGVVRLFSRPSVVRV
jgi:hypothetical protein